MVLSVVYLLMGYGFVSVIDYLRIRRIPTDTALKIWICDFGAKKSIRGADALFAMDHFSLSTMAWARARASSMWGQKLSWPSFSAKPALRITCMG